MAGGTGGVTCCRGTRRDIVTSLPAELDCCIVEGAVDTATGPDACAHVVGASNEVAAGMPQAPAKSAVCKGAAKGLAPRPDGSGKLGRRL